MIEATVTREGKMENVLKELRAYYAPRLQRAAEASALVLLEESNKRCPEDTGALRASGRIRRIGSGLTTVFIVGYAATDFDASPYGEARKLKPPCEYWHFPYFGWEMSPTPNPFLDNAVDPSIPKMREAIRKETQ